MIQSQHQPLNPIDEDNDVEMSRIDENSIPHKSWLLHSESEEEHSDEERNGTMRRITLRRRKSSDPILVSAIRKSWCCRLYCCCSRSTCKIILLVLILLMTFSNFSFNVRFGSCWTARDELELLNRYTQDASDNNEGPWPLVHAHSHNDYQGIIPRQAALFYGFCSLEGDVYLLPDGLLYLGHVLAAVNTETLQGTYLDPLVALVKANNGVIYKRALKTGTCEQITLLVDIKTAEADSAIQTWEVLERLLDSLDTPLEDGRPIFETLDADGKVIPTENSVRPSPIRVVVTGIGGITGRVANLMASRKSHKTSIDLNFETNDPTMLKMSRWVSEKWSMKFPDSDAQSVAQTVARIQQRAKFAQQHNLKSRYWGTPENPALWSFLLKNGVDFINTDSLGQLHYFLTGKNSTIPVA